ncbi:MAG: LysM peptidoglycan-binding domain-containing protein [Chloroflexi bacterium]|nr:LysM peptidoglycan-binding domain-containing protein [Chloroflexota bacterium]
MNRQKNQNQILIMLSALAITSLFCITSGGNSNGILTASIDEIQGKVQTLNPEEGLFVDAVNGQEIEVNHQVLTLEDGRARVNLSNGTIIRVGPLSVFTLKDMEISAGGPFARFNLEVGKLWVILNGGSVDVETPAGLASVRGSYMSVQIDPITKEAIITCLEGNCQIGNEAGTVNLIAGQKVSVMNLQSAPVPGFMSDEDVNNWLANNPEATIVVARLTSTVAALQGNPLPSVLTPTGCPIPPGWVPRIVLPNESFTSLAELYSTTAETLANGNCMDVGASLESGSSIFVPPSSANLTPTPTAVQCGPSTDWIIYIVNSGETLAQLAEAYNISLADLQYANCLGDSTIIFAGMSLYVPNIGPPTPTPTVVPTVTMTTQASITPTTSGGSGTNAIFTNVLGPVGGSISTCSNLFAVSVIDPDGIDYVEVELSLNDATFSNSTFVNLPFQVDDKYSKTMEINTASNSGPDVVFWRFAMADIFNNHQWYPEIGTTPYSYSDSLDCGLATTIPPSSTPQPTNTPVPTVETPGPATFFSAPIYPTDGNAVISCANIFSIDVSDADGVSFVKMEYSLNNAAAFPSPYYVILTQAGNTWSDVLNIDTSLQAGTDVVYWRFWAIDGQGNYSYYPEVGSFSYTDSLDCIG